MLVMVIFAGVQAAPTTSGTTPISTFENDQGFATLLYNPEAVSDYDTGFSVEFAFTITPDAVIKPTEFEEHEFDGPETWIHRAVVWDQYGILACFNSADGSAFSAETHYNAATVVLTPCNNEGPTTEFRRIHGDYIGWSHFSGFVSTAYHEIFTEDEKFWNIVAGVAIGIVGTVAVAAACVGTAGVGCGVALGIAWTAGAGVAQYADLKISRDNGCDVQKVPESDVCVRFRATKLMNAEAVYIPIKAHIHINSTCLENGDDTWDAIEEIFWNARAGSPPPFSEKPYDSGKFCFHVQASSALSVSGSIQQPTDLTIDDGGELAPVIISNQQGKHYVITATTRHDFDFTGTSIAANDANPAVYNFDIETNWDFEWEGEPDLRVNHMVNHYERVVKSHMSDIMGAADLSLGFMVSQSSDGSCSAADFDLGLAETQASPMVQCLDMEASSVAVALTALTSTHIMTGEATGQGLKKNGFDSVLVPYDVTFDLVPRIPCLLNCASTFSAGDSFALTADPDRVNEARAEIKGASQELYGVDPTIVTLYTKDMDLTAYADSIDLETMKVSQIDVTSSNLPKLEEPLYFLLVEA